MKLMSRKANLCYCDSRERISRYGLKSAMLRKSSEYSWIGPRPGEKAARRRWLQPFLWRCFCADLSVWRSTVKTYSTQSGWPSQQPDAAAIAAAEESTNGNTAEQNAANAISKLNGMDTTLATHPATVTISSPLYLRAPFGLHSSGVLHPGGCSPAHTTYFMGVLNHGDHAVGVRPGCGSCWPEQPYLRLPGRAVWDGPEPQQ